MTNAYDLVPEGLRGWMNAAEDRIRRDVEGEAQRAILQELGRVAGVKSVAAKIKQAKEAIPVLQGYIDQREAERGELQQKVDEADQEYKRALAHTRQLAGSKVEAAAELAQGAAYNAWDRAQSVLKITDNDIAAHRQAQRELQKIIDVLGSIPSPDVGLLRDVLAAVPAVKSK